MKKIFFPLLILASLLVFSCKDLSENLVADVDAIRSNISLTYEFTDTGSYYSWTKPNHLDSHADRFFISENSDSSKPASQSFTCKDVDSAYQDTRYNDKVSIKKSCSSVEFSYRPTATVYLWVEIDNTDYNLGEFVPKVLTATNQIKSQIKLNVDTTDIDNLKFQWAIPATLSINPRRFIISKDSTSSYSDASHTFSCLVIKSSYQESYYGDNVSVRRDCYKLENNYRTYDVVASSETPTDYYLWIQIESGQWYNLGQFVVRNAKGSGSGSGSGSSSGSTTTNSSVSSIRNSIQLTYTFTNEGTKLTWTKPTGLSSLAKYYMISENSDSMTTGSLTCKKIPASYQDTSYGDEVSIKASCSYVILDWLVLTSQELYLWVADSSETYYNLGKFTTTISDIASIKNNVTTFGDFYDTGSYDQNGYLVWSIPASYKLNALRFIVATDSASYYAAANTTFSCKRVEDDYRNTLYNDNVSIKTDCYTTTSGYNFYEIYLESQLTSTYYLWVQIEDGSWHNLGKILMQ